ncbi:MAG: hypothetical protein AB1480_00330 [Nitrospirota bacterium]
MIVKIFLIVLYLLLLLTTTCYTNNEETVVTVDFLSKSGNISNYIAGTTAGPFYDEGSYKLLKDGNFKLIQVMIWLSRPQSSPHGEKGFRPQFPFFEQRSKQSFPDNFKEELFPQIQLAKRQIHSIFDIGAEPLIFMITSRKPFDMEEYQKQVRNIIDELRSSAKEMGKDLLLFRFGNEPEARIYWEGSRKEFFETYRVWADAVKSVDPNFIVEAPGFASATARFFKDNYYDKVNEFTKEFLDYCKENQVPLDVFSFHYYGTNINNLANELEAVRRELAKYPNLSPVFGIPRIGIDEWNIHVFGFPDKRYIKIFDTAHTAAQNVAALIIMVKNSAWLSIRFGGVSTSSSFKDKIDKENIKIGKDFLMSRSDGRPKPVYYAFSAFNRMFSTPILLGEYNKEGFYLIAGKSSDEHQINIVTSFYDEIFAENILREEDSSKYQRKIKITHPEIRIKNFPWHKVTNEVEITRYVVDDMNDLKIVDKTIFKKDGSKELSIKFEATTPSVVFIQIKWK